MRLPRVVSVVGLMMIAFAMTQGPLGIMMAADGASSEPTGPTVASATYGVEVWGPYAVTNVETVLENPSERPINHTFAFKVPEGALISNFSLAVGGRTFYADVLEKVFAQEQYSNAVNAGYTAGLVASKGDSVFTYGISLAPKEAVKVGLRFEQVLLKANGRYSYGLDLTADRTPLRVGTFSFAFHLLATGAIEDLRTEGYDGHWSASVLGPCDARASMVATDLVPTEDIAIAWGSLPGPLEGTMYFGERDGMGYFAHIYEPDPALVAGERLPKDFVFVMDRSGSMKGTKIQQSKDALALIYASLGDEDRFSLVTFNSQYYVFSDSLMDATADAKHDVLEYIGSVEAGGSTDIHSPLLGAVTIFEAAEDPVPIIVLLSDGQANTGLYARSPFRQDVLAKNKVDASIYCIALGHDADWEFLEAMALENHGSAILVNEKENVVEKISSFVGSFAQPLLADLSFSYGPAAQDVYPAKVRAHFIGTEVLVTGTFPLGTRQITASLAYRGQEGAASQEHTFAVPDDLGADFVPMFWAFERIKALEDQMKWNGTDDASVKESIRLAIGFHFATDRTSLYVELPEELQNRFGEPAEQMVAVDDAAEASLGLRSFGTTSTQTNSYGSSPSTDAASGGSSPPPTASASTTSYKYGGSAQGTSSLGHTAGTGAQPGASDTDGVPDVVPTTSSTDGGGLSSWKVDTDPSWTSGLGSLVPRPPSAGTPVAYLPDYIVTALIVSLTTAAVYHARRRLRRRA